MARAVTSADAFNAVAEPRRRQIINALAGAAERLAADQPSALIHSDAAGSTEIRATPVAGHAGAYTAAVVLPESGTWTYHVHDAIADGGYEFPPIVVADPSNAMPTWLLAGAALPAGVLTAATAWRARPRSSLRAR